MTYYSHRVIFTGGIKSMKEPCLQSYLQHPINDFSTVRAIFIRVNAHVCAHEAWLVPARENFVTELFH